jgi:hypothetical protein
MSIQQNFPNTRPSLSINFARSQTLDPRITFTRTTSGTRVGPDGYIEVIPADQPRFDFDPVTGECLGLLIEEQRVNNYHIWNSTTDSSSTINPVNIDTQIVSSVLTPRGLPATAYTATKTGNANQYHGLGGGANSFSISSNTSISASAYIKDFNNSDYRLLFVISAYNVSTNNNRYILYRARPLTGEWVGGTVHSSWTVTSNVKDVGNGWYRFEISGTNTYEAGWDMINFSFQLLNESNQQFYDPPTANTHGIYLSSPQYELGSFPTSYIPTNNANGTRTADNASITGSNFTEWYNPSEGTVYCSANNNPGVTTATSRFFYAFERSDGTSSDFIRKWIWNGNTGLLLNSIYTSNSGPIAAEFNTTLETTNKRTAIAYKQNDFARSYNGSTPSTDNIGNLPVGINQVRIGTNLSGHISQLTYYPTRLSNQVLQNLTK